MELFRVIGELPKYVRWVRSGRPEFTHHVASESPDDILRREIGEAASSVLGRGVAPRWRYSFNEGRQELGDPSVWEPMMPSWITILPDLESRTLISISAEKLTSRPLPEDLSLFIDFRNLTDELRLETFSLEMYPEIYIARYRSDESERLELHGSEMHKLTLVKEAWQLAARMRKELGTQWD